MERSSGKLPKTPDKVNRSIFSSTQVDNYRTKTPPKPFSNEAIPERLNFSIETKKKASIIEKISSLAPFLESLIGKSEIRSAQILDRLVELRTHLDEIFQEISIQFEAAQVQNDDLRNSLETIPRQRAQAQATVESQRLQRLVDQLRAELQQVRAKEADAGQQLSQLRSESREAYEILQNIKRESERLRAANAEFQKRIRELEAKPKGLSPDEQKLLREELERERGKSMGLEEYSRKKLAEYEAKLNAENKKYRDLEAIHSALSRKSDLNENEIRQLKELIQREGRKSLSLEENVRRKIQQNEQTNSELRRKIQEDEAELQGRLRRIHDLEAENAEREKRIKEFARKSDLNEKEIAMIKDAMDNERRQSMANEQNLFKKLQAVENEKKALLSRADQNDEKARQYEDILEKLTTEVEKDRRESMVYQKNATDKIRTLEKKNIDLSSEVDNSKAKHVEDERVLRQLYDSIKEKERKYNQYIQELGRKSNLHEDEIRLIKDELDKERRKSLADEATIKRLERVVEDQTKNTRDQVALLQAQIEKERRKSMADEAAIRKMQQILNQKVYFLNQSDKKHKLANDQIDFLKQEIDKERRKSMQDEATIRKLEQILQEKEKHLADVDKRGKQYDQEIKAIKQELDNERRKSMQDQATIKKLEQELANKIKLANDNHNKYIDLARKSEAGDEEIKFLKAEIDKERRKSSADEALIKKLEMLLAEKVKLIQDNKKKQQDNDDQIKFLQRQIQNERRKSMADQTKIRKLEDMLKEKIAIAEQNNSNYLEQVRKSEINVQELNFLMAELDKERRKSMADEATIKRLEKIIAEKIKYAEDNEGRFVNEIKILKNEIENQRRKSMADETKIRKLEEMLQQKLKLAENQKNQILELARKTDLNENEIKMLQAEIDKERRKSMADVAMIKKLEAVIGQKTRALQEREENFIRNNEEIQFLKAEIDKERRKSMADEAQIKKLEQILQAKVNQAHENHRRAEELARKSNLNEEEIKFLKDQIEKDRRASVAGQDNFMRKVRELEGTKDDLMKKLEDDKQRFIKTANYIKQLEEKNNNAERLYSDAARISELNADEIERLKIQMDKERRKSVSLQQTFLPKIHLLVDQNQNLLRDIQSLKIKLKQADDKIAELSDHMNKSKQAIQYLEDQSRNKDRAISDLERTIEQQGYRNQQKLNDTIEDKARAVRDAEAELNRAKQERASLQQQLSSKTSELQNQRDAISQLERILNDKENALSQEENNNQALAKLLNEMKAKERQLIERNNYLNQVNTSNNITYEQHLQGYLQKQPLTENNTASTLVISETSRQEREHVIKVLEHERRIYKLETSLTKPRGGQHPNRIQTFDNNSNQEVQPFDSEFGTRQDEQRFDGRTSSPIRLGGGQPVSNSKRPRILSEI